MLTIVYVSYIFACTQGLQKVESRLFGTLSELNYHDLTLSELDYLHLTLSELNYLDLTLSELNYWVYMFTLF